MHRDGQGKNLPNTVWDDGNKQTKSERQLRRDTHAQWRHLKASRQTSQGTIEHPIDRTVPTPKREKDTPSSCPSLSPNLPKASIQKLVAYLPALVSFHHLDLMDFHLLFSPFCDTFNGGYTGVGEAPAKHASTPRKGVAYSSLGTSFRVGVRKW